MHLTKMHGCGNDYWLTRGPVTVSAGLVRALCDRRRGLGSDGLIVVTPEADRADVSMRIYNADGSDGGMCGNGVRCVAAMALERGWASGPSVRIDAGGRVVEAERVEGGLVRVDMGEPRLALAEIPVDAAGLDEVGEFGVEHQVGGLPAVFVSMGNPHMVAMIEGDPAGWDLGDTGPFIERHRAFPERINLHLTRIIERDAAEARSWERGAGATLACGTGACAVQVAGVLTGRLDREAAVRMPGGVLGTEWDDRTGRVFLTGPAETVGTAEWDARERAGSPPC